MFTKTFQYKIRKNRKFEEAAQKALDDSRFVYNCALEQRILRYKQGKPVGFIDQSRELTEARESMPEICSCIRRIQEDALKRIAIAFEGFFGRIKTGEKPGFPRFKNSNQYSTFSQNINTQRPSPLSFDFLKVPGVGTCRVRLSRPTCGIIKQIRISRRHDGWYASLVCEFPKPDPIPEIGKPIGIDLGLDTFATLSTGEKVVNPRFLHSKERALKRSQRALSRTKLRSANRQKARQRLAKRHLKVANTRKDFHHKVALDLVRRFDTIKIEDLQILKMIQDAKLSKSIHDAGWGQFIQILTYKAENAGRQLVRVNPAYTSQTCSKCGHRQKMPLSCRTFNCPQCGLVIDRDHNAAINIGRGTPESKPVESPKGRRGNRNTDRP